MNITAQQKQCIEQFIPTFKNYLGTSDREDDLLVRKERIEKFGRLLSPSALTEMTELEFGQVVSSLWSSLMWSDKGYLVDKLLSDNGLPKFKESLNNLLWSDLPIETRYNNFRKNIKGFGSGFITEILAFVHPQSCALWNNKARQALILLGFEDTFPIVKKQQISGSEYKRFIELMFTLQKELALQGIPDLDLLGIDYFFFEVWKAGWKTRALPAQEVPIPQVTTLSDFDHEEMIDQIIAIGQWLGFEVHKEKMIAAGSKVDAVWQARIANLGVVTYVFEVQRHGSIDSLILNLQRAQNNPSVQRLIVVALPGEIVKIKKEIETLPESFRRSIGYMEVEELIRASDLVTDLSGIMSKLELVKGEFEIS